jgi:hypothetical protein
MTLAMLLRLHREELYFSYSVFDAGYGGIYRGC